ncbi:amino acid adenylation domain-containing protein [Leptolyngbya sp. FACHB-36]|uniref:amino acid adenylation domain-containing protein n=1 Tax=Leptolyngbya sp. FACHB-36 TaxID=2692808 RepID=UPI001681B4CA|nr:non-ribosomal peptide synthetase [Leptolyngbya sp. FACHB-36]MBD2020581.1 amino acid adenylation domain-containing protein [Leptolyngbya sp. FACHB-36]
MANQERSLQLPSDFLKTPTLIYQSGYCAAPLPSCWAELSKEPVPVSDSEGRSLLLAAFNALVYRYTQQETIGLTLTIADAKLERNSTTELYTSITNEVTVRELMDQFTHALNNLQEQEPPDSVLDSHQHRLHSPISITVVESVSDEDEQRWLAHQKAAELTNYPDLHLIIFQQEQRVTVLLNYNASLFKADTIKRLLGHWQVLVEGMVRDRACLIVQLPLLAEAEHQLLVKSTSVNYPLISIHRQIEAQATHYPNAIAVTFQEQHLTYAELNGRANQLAHYLNRIGVKEGVPVAVCVEPSLDIAISLLAIFKAGGIYVPLDPSYPKDRLTTIAEDTQPHVLLTQSHLLPNLPAVGLIFCCDHGWRTVQSLPTHNLEHEAYLDQTAYLVYTSGTTGKPKGVMASHRNLIHYISVAQKRFGWNRQDVMPTIARFTFSISLFELLSPLVVGGTLMILEREHILDFQRLAQTLTQLTVLHASPSLMRKLLAYIQEAGLDKSCHHLRHVSCGGDLVPADLLERMQTVFPQAELYVIYGCSEISCMGCAYPVAHHGTAKSRVGTPFDNVSVRLYDPHGNLVPIGVVGEVYISGAGVTQGYLNRQDLTQEKFVAIEGQQFYRTGDLGRFDAEGNLELLGRNDFQIQLRGMRIEPGEIEAALRQTEGVREAVVVARELGTGEVGLVAYIVPEPQFPAIEQLRQQLQAKLPDYMVPAVFVRLDALPLTPNQKVDRRSLPDPEWANQNYMAPRNALEQLIADIWQTVLGLQVGIHDDFFALGGHSLLATQVVHRLRDALKLEIPISRLFESPTVAELAEHLAPLSQAQSCKLNGVPRITAITAIQRDDYLPLSASQAGLWFLSQLEEGCSLNIPLAYDLVGVLHKDALAQSLTKIVRRHEPLRTVFSVIKGAPVQRILPPQPVPLAVVDLQTLPEAEQRAEVRRLTTAAAQHSFNLAVDLPLQVTLLRLSETAHVLLVTIHHIAADGWSLAVFRRELTALYTSYVQGTASPLQELPIQYADFAQWQQQWLGELSQQLAYWQQQLAGAPPLLELPTDRPRPTVQTFQGGREYFTLDSALTRQLKHLSQRVGATLFMTLLAALATLLSRYSRQQDLVIGSPIANRHHSELEPLIGCFINMLALRIDLSDNPDFLGLLKRVRQVALDAYANQDVSFGQIRDAVQTERNLSHSPLFQVMLVLQNSPSEAFELPGLSLSPRQVESGLSQYDLSLMMEETAAGLTGEFEYNRDLFDSTTIAGMVRQFQTLLSAIAADPAQPIAALPLLTASEQQQLLALSSGIPRSQAQVCIHQLFEAQVERTPNQIAVVFGQQHLTYRELNQRANQLAHYLRSQQIEPDALVAVWAERSLETIVAFLGVLKMGGAYIPIDPTYPLERQVYMLGDARVPVILTQSHLVETLPEHDAQIVQLDVDWATIAHQPSENPSWQTRAETLAYIMYTSGSTGAPKGAMITHEGMVNHSTAIVEEFDLQPSDRVLQFSSLSFDIAVEELFPSLIQGATVVLRTEACIVPKHFVQFIQEHQITVLDLPTAFWHELVHELPALGTLPDCVRLVIVGGEKALRSSYINWCQRVNPQVRWLNTYGPTEATVTATLYDPAASEFAPTLADIPIGRPISNTQVYILDSQLQLVPVGVPGELHIAGVGLARGYLNRPDLTCEKFIPNPFGPDRLYKTGDLARYLANGQIEFLGRIDQQVKIRGFRIELGEIETVLGQHPQVRDVVVLARTTAGQPQLVAYVVLQPAELNGTTGALREFLKDKLPSYMLPAAIVSLEALPLTPNGKVDYRALPMPDLGVGDRTRAAVAPRDSLERQLAEVWQDVLGVPTIGITDNFFDLGGHSLLAVRLCTKIETLLNQEFSVARLFQAPTIEQLAAQLRQPETTLVCPSFVMLQAGTAASPPLFCIHVLGRGMKFYRPVLQYLNPQQAVYGLSTNLTGELLPSNSVEDLAAHYLQQIQTIQPTGPYYLIGVSFGGVVAFEIAQQLLKQNQSVEFLGLLDTYAPGAVRSLSMSQQVKEHWRYLSSLGPSYVLKKVRDKGSGQIQSLTGSISKAQHRLGIKLMEATGQALPENFQDFMYEEQSQRLGSTYKLQPYPGAAILFKASEQFSNVSLQIDPAMGWGEVIAGGLEIHQITGTHLSILQEPHVQVLGATLQACLTRVRASTSASL